MTLLCCLLCSLLFECLAFKQFIFDTNFKCLPVWTNMSNISWMIAPKSQSSMVGEIAQLSFVFLIADSPWHWRNLEIFKCQEKLTHVTLAQNNRHLIVHSEKEPKWLYIQRNSQIGCKFRERAKLSVHLEKESTYLSIPIWAPFLKTQAFSYPIQLFLQINSQINSFSYFTVNSALSPNVLLSV